MHQLPTLLRNQQGRRDGDLDSDISLPVNRQVINTMSSGSHNDGDVITSGVSISGMPTSLPSAAVQGRINTSQTLPPWPLMLRCHDAPLELQVTRCAALCLNFTRG